MPVFRLASLRVIRFAVAMFATIAGSVVAAPAAANVTATFNDGAIAEYSNNANQNNNARSFATLGISNIVLSQSGSSWGGTQGNDLNVTLTITFTDTTTATVTGALNWQLNDGGAAIPVNYFGVTTGTQVADSVDRYTRSNQTLGKTYILVLPSKVVSSNFYSLIPSNTDGSANLNYTAIFQSLQAEYPVANAAPNFTGASATDANGAAAYSFSYPEGATTSTVLGTVAATDTADTTNDTVTYSIDPSSNPNGWYTIDPSTGQIKLTQAGVASIINDYDELTNNSRTITVIASDGVLSTTIEVQLAETNVNDPPVFTGATPGAGTNGVPAYTFSYQEGATGTTVLGTVAAADPESGSLTYTITGGDSSIYQIDSTTGQITLKQSALASAANDFEAGTNQQMIQVTVSDGTNSTVIEVYLNETDVADAAPVFTGNTSPVGTNGAAAYSFSYPENTSTTTVLGTVSASDADGGTLTFAIDPASDPSGWYTIDPASGEIKLTTLGAASLANNFEAQGNSRTLTVTVSDGTYTTTIEVLLAETNVADAAPVFTGNTSPVGTNGAAAYSFSYPENTSTTTVLGTVSASDADGGTLTFAIDPASDPSGWYTIDSNTGEIKLTTLGAASLANNFEAQGNSRTLTVTVSDGTYTTTIEVLLAETDVDDTPPAIQGPNSNAGAAESALTMNEGLTSVFTFTTGEQNVVWALDGGSDAGAFSINPATGALVFRAAPDFENPTDTDHGNTYVVRIKVTDQNDNVSYQTLTVTIVNVDEIAAKIAAIRDDLRNSLRNRALRGLGDMLSFNEGLMRDADDADCASDKKKVRGGFNANESAQNASLGYSDRMGQCGRRWRALVDAGVVFSRSGGLSDSRLMGSFRIENRIDEVTTAGLGVMASTASNSLEGFGNSSVSDQSIQLNLYLRRRLDDNLRAGVFAAYGWGSYDFGLHEADGFVLDGDISSHRYAMGAMLSGDVVMGDLVVTTDAILSHAVEKLGSATLAAQYKGESRTGIAFEVGKVDITRLSVPVTAPLMIVGEEGDSGAKARLLFSPGLLCEDTSAAGSSLTCGYQIGGRLVSDNGGRGRLYGDYRFESVDGRKRTIIGIGVARRFGSANGMELAFDLNRAGSVYGNADGRAMLTLRLAQ